MNDFVMPEEPRFVDGAGDCPAAILLRSARTDKAPKDSKDRVRAMLGLAEEPNEVNGLPLAVSLLPNRGRDERAKRSKQIAKFVPFQYLLAAPKPRSVRKLGGIGIAAVQVAAILAAIFVRPVPRIGPVAETTASRSDEPELSFHVPKTTPTETSNAQNRLAQNTTKASMARKEKFGAVNSLRSAPTRERAPLMESIVGEEHAGVLAQKEEPVAHLMAPLAPQFSGTIAAVATSPMAFQDGMAQPVRISGTDPSYPQVARLRGVKGTVIMRCVLTEKGLAQNCTILKSPAYLDDAVLSVANTWRFKPMTWQGRVVPVNYVFKINFKLG